MKTTLFSTFLVLAVLLLQGQWSYTNISEAKFFMGSTTLGNKAYFAGGFNGTEFFTKVEIYDLSTGTWDSVGHLSVPRQIIGGSVGCGSKIFFAGGFDEAISYNIVDIYDTLETEWSIEFLSTDRFSHAAVSQGNTVMFAGGVQIQGSPVFLKTVEMYNIETGLWTIDSLSQPRMGIAAAVVGDLAIFAGGMINLSGNTTNRVDIYNFTTHTWNQAELSEARSYASATTVGTKVIIGGGVIGLNTPTNVVDIYDASDGSWTTSNHTIPRSAINNAATVNGKAYFAGGGIFMGSGFYDPYSIIDIYDPETNSWTIDLLSEPIIYHSVLGVGNYLIVAGGKNDQGDVVSTVEIFKDLETGIKSKPDESVTISVYPNPCNNILTINTPKNGVIIYNAVIYSQAGQKVLQGKPINNTLDISKLRHGMFIIELKTDQGEIRQKLIIH